MADAVHQRGYTDTSVASIIANAGVSRETFYQLYESKLECYLDALDFVSAVMIDHMEGVAAAAEGAPKVERVRKGLAAYLEAIAAAPGFARLFLVESFAAGPDAMQRRAAAQGRFADSMADLMGIDGSDSQSRFACRLFVAGISALVTTPIVSNDTEGITSLLEPLMTEASLRFPQIRS